MPNLRIFDMQSNYASALDAFLYACLIGGFHSKFWTEKQWFFEHRHDHDDSSRSGIFFSTNPYR
ncbi:unnamed protein product, partial [Rotaria magnacalcarata]